MIKYQFLSPFPGNIGNMSFFGLYRIDCGRCGYLMLIARSESIGVGSRPGWLIGSCSWETHLSLTMPLHPGKSMGARERSGNLDELLEDNCIGQVVVAGGVTMPLYTIYR